MYFGVAHDVHLAAGCLYSRFYARYLIRRFGCAAKRRVHHPHALGTCLQAHRHERRNHSGIGGAGVLRWVVIGADIGLDDHVVPVADEARHASQGLDRGAGDGCRVGSVHHRQVSRCFRRGRLGVGGGFGGVSLRRGSFSWGGLSCRDSRWSGWEVAVGLISLADGSVGVVVLGLGVQLARAAPAATVAVSLRNVRRERFGRRFMSLSPYRIPCLEIPVMVMRWMYYKRNLW